MAAKGEEIKIRVPKVMKRAVNQIAASRLTSESEITREAIREYLERRGFDLREASVLDTASSKGQQLAEEIGEETLRKHEQRAARGKKSHGKPAT